MIGGEDARSSTPIDDRARNVLSEAGLQNPMEDVKGILGTLGDYGVQFFPCKLDKSPATDGRSWKSYGWSLGQAFAWMQGGGLAGGELPKGLVIIDIDRHPGKPDGFESMAKAGFSIDDLRANTLAVKTGGGGVHLYFTTDENHPVIKGHPFPGVDIKSFGGYVVLAGSPGYTALNDFEPQPLPDELARHIFKQEMAFDDEPAKSKNGKTKIDYEIGEKQRPSLEQLKRLLDDDRLNPAKHFPDRSRWFEFVQVLTAVYGTDKETLGVIGNWSISDKKYSNSESMEETWRTLLSIGQYNKNFHPGSLSYILTEKGFSRAEIASFIDDPQGRQDAGQTDKQSDPWPLLSDVKEYVPEIFRSKEYDFFEESKTGDKNYFFRWGINVLGGGASSGKTTLLLAMAIDLLRENPEVAFLFYSLDDSPSRIKRKIAMMGGADLFSRIVVVADFDIETLEAGMDAVMEKTGAKKVIVGIDYIQLLGNEREELNATTKKIKEIVNNREILFFALSQLARGTGDLRESSELDNFADLICILERPVNNKGFPDYSSPMRTLRIRKNKEGVAGDEYGLYFSREKKKFIPSVLDDGDGDNAGMSWLSVAGKTKEKQAGTGKTSFRKASSLSLVPEENGEIIKPLGEKPSLLASLNGGGES